MNRNQLKRKIIETAAGCFLKYGIKNTSMDFVSEVLHISKRTLYRFFPGKRDLLEACVEFRLEAGRKRIERQCELSGPHRGGCLYELWGICIFQSILSRFPQGCHKVHRCPYPVR